MMDKLCNILVEKSFYAYDITTTTTTTIALDARRGGIRILNYYNRKPERSLKDILEDLSV